MDPKTTLAAQEKAKKSMTELREERESFGSKNVDVLLQREEELLKNWALMMDAPDLAKAKR